MPTSRARLLGLAAAAASVAMVSCGGGTSARSLATEAASKTTAAGSAKFTVDATATASGRTISESGNGVVDFHAHAIHVTFPRPGQNGAPSKDQASFIVGNDVWSTTPASVSAAMPAAKPYVHTTVDAQNATPLAQLTQPNDPTRWLADLAGIDPATVKKRGSEKVLGVGTTHIEASIDLRKVSDATAKSQADALERITGSPVVPAQLWVDSSGRLRRFELTLSHIKVSPAATTASSTAPRPASGLEVDLVITTEFSDFGTEVTVTPPPADQVMVASAVTR
jgi:hypothetical protein